jgi:hypothetical protein
MVSIADYKVLRDSTFDLDEGERKELVFDVPSAELATESLIVAYQARPLSVDSDEDFVELSVALASRRRSTA